MKVLFLLIGPERIASSRVRVYQFLPRLRADLGIIPTIRLVGSTLRTSIHPIIDFIAGVVVKRWRLLMLVPSVWFSHSYDVVFIHRVLLPPWLIRRLVRLGKKIVFDFDDALGVEGFYRRAVAEKRLESVLKAAFLVITSSDYNSTLVREKNLNFEVIASSVDLSHYQRKSFRPTNSPIVIGWIGSPSTTPYLGAMATVLRELSSRYSILVHVIGGSLLEIPGVSIVHKAWTPETEGKDLAEIDIGIMPLPDNEWTRGKGGYKLLQYMATGLPVVASPVSINKDLIKDGINGFLASTNEEWTMRLSNLIEDFELRKTMGNRGFAMVQEHYSSEHSYRQLRAALSMIMGAS